jgi:hypothetical protein
MRRKKEETNGYSSFRDSISANSNLIPPVTRNSIKEIGFIN